MDSFMLGDFGYAEVPDPSLCRSFTTTESLGRTHHYWLNEYGEMEDLGVEQERKKSKWERVKDWIRG